jgi:hypothetical protein
MDLTNGLSALTGALIGAGGAVAAQAVSARFNGKREDRRFAWEQAQQEAHQAEQKSQQDREDTVRAHSRFLDLKRELYGKFIAMSDAIMEQVNDRILAPESPLKDWRPELAELALLRFNISVIASDEMDDMVSATQSVVSSAYYHVLNEQGDLPIPDANDALFDLLHAMRRDIYRDLQAGRKSVDLENVEWRYFSRRPA